MLGVSFFAITAAGSSAASASKNSDLRQGFAARIGQSPLGRQDSNYYSSPAAATRSQKGG